MTPAPDPVRIDGVAKVTGAARYVADLQLPGMLHGRILRSPHPHARIVAIDAARARAVEGVRVVLTGHDLPPQLVGRAIRDVPVLARDRVRFVGERVAAVAAETEAAAERALELIDVDYEPLPAVFDPIAAMQPDAPVIHDKAAMRARTAPNQVVPDEPNVVARVTWGASEAELAAAFAAAERVVEHEIRLARQHQAYLEPHVAIAEVGADGCVHLWATNKAPFLLLAYLSEGLGIDPRDVRFHPHPLGGDFGGKGSAMDIPVAIALARATGRPVRLAMTYPDEFRSANPRHAAIVRVRSAVRSDGRVTARLVHAVYDSGAYAGFKPSLDGALPEIRTGAVGAYDIAPFRLVADVVHTNNVPGGHMRNPGGAQTTAAVEIHTDRLAHELGLSPLEVRRRNVTQRPRAVVDGGPPVAARARAALERAAAEIGYTEPRPAGVGRAVALLALHTSPGIYSGTLVIRADGTVLVRTPLMENGAGMLTALRSLVADELGIAAERVSVEQTTEGFSVDRGIGGSRVTRMESILVGRLADAAARQLGGGVTTVDRRGLVDAVVATGRPLEVHDTFRATAEDEVVVHVAQAAEVAVDVETGEVRLRRLVSVHDVGRVVNPVAFRGQVDGALAQAAGYALLEGLEAEEGVVATLNFNEYRIPAHGDVPPPEVVLLPPEPRLGVTPVGESGAAMAPAIVNAIADAAGVPILRLPVRPEALVRATRSA